MGILDMLETAEKERYQKIEQEAHRLFQLGQRYMTGDGVAQSDADAVLSYLKALTLWEDPQVDYEVARSYSLGIAVKRDPEIAKRFMRRGTLIHPETMEPLIRLEIETKEMEAALYYGQFLAGQDPELDAELDRVRTGQAEGRLTSRQCLERMRENAPCTSASCVYQYAVGLLEALALVDTGSPILDYKINLHLNRYAEEPEALWQDAVFWAVLAEQFTDGNVELRVPISEARALSAACLSLICSYPPETPVFLPGQPWQQAAPELRDTIEQVRRGSFSPDLIGILRRYADAGSYHAAAQLHFLSYYVDSEKDATGQRAQQLTDLQYPPFSGNCLLMATAALHEQDPVSCLELARVLDGASKADLEHPPAASLLAGVYFMWTVRLYERRISQGDLEATYRLSEAYSSSLLGDTEKHALWQMEGVKKGYAPSIMEAVDHEAKAQSLAEQSIFKEHNLHFPAKLIDLAQSVPDNFYRKKELIQTVNDILPTLKLLVEQNQRDINARIRAQLRAEEKQFGERLDRQERAWNFFLRGYDLTSEEWAWVDLSVGNTERVTDYALYKSFVRDVKEKKNSEKIRRELEEEEIHRRAEQRTERTPDEPKIKGRLSAASFPEPDDRDRWLEESGLGDTARLLESLEPFDYEKANEQYHLSKCAESAGERAAAFQTALRLGHKVALYDNGDILASALLWYAPAMTAYYEQNPDTELGELMLRRASLLENEGAEFEQAKLWIHQGNRPRAGVNLLKKLSNQGHAEAKEELALCFLSGTGGLEKNPQIAFSLMEESAKKANPSACFNLGVFYEGGVGRETDIPAALKWYHHAADMGDGNALCRLAQFYMTGKYMEQNWPKGLVYCVQGVLLDDGSCRDLFESLTLESMGDPARWYGYPQPLPEARKQGIFGFLQKLTPEEQAIDNVIKDLRDGKNIRYSNSDDVLIAARSGIMQAREALAERHLSHKSMFQADRNKNLLHAFFWFDQAAQVGSPDALRRMAWWFDSGIAGFHNEGLARIYARLAAERGGEEYANYWKLGAPAGTPHGREDDDSLPRGKNSVDNFNMGLSYRGKDEEKAFHYFMLSAKDWNYAGETEVGYRYSIGLGVAQDWAQAIYWFRKAAEDGSSQAMYNLGVCYENGDGVTKDLGEAFRWYERAAQADHQGGMFAVGYCYEFGWGTAQDDKQAASWYWRVANLGHAQAMYRMGICHEFGKGVKQDEKDAFRWYEASAQAGYADAQCETGYRYEVGKGTDKDNEQAISWYRKSAGQGNAVAMCNLALCYEVGRGTEPDMQQALEWYQKAAEAGNAQAMYNLGLCYENGQGVDKNEEEAFRWYERSAQADYASGQLETGYRCEMGKGTDKNEEQAVYWYRKSGQQGNAAAMCNLAYCCEVGRGIAADIQQALEWYQKAADAGSARAMYNLGLCYEYGKGVDKSEEEAFRWYECSAQAGYASGQLETGYRCEMGKGTDKNEEQAVYWYRKSGQQGNAMAMCNLALCYEVGRGTEPDIQQALEWYQKAVDAGSARAMYRMGLCYADGKGVDKNEEEAFRWYERSAQADYADGQFKTAYCYAKGQGVEKGPEKAVYWYQKAAEKGNRNAMNNLGLCYEKGNGIAQDLEQAAYWYRKAGEKGNLTSMCNLGNLLLKGEGVEKDPKAAVEWFQRAAKGNFARGKYLLAKCLLDGNGIEADREAAITLLQEAASQNYKSAQELLDSINAG